jgi:transcriptional regulator with GAF, ATPase, and Fis domain
MVGPFEEWVKTNQSDLEVRKVAGAMEAMEALSTFGPELMVVERSIGGEEREALLRQAGALGCTTVAAAAGVQIPGATMQDIEKYAILETLKSVGGSTSKAAKVLGISVRKIQYRLRDWNLRSAQIAEPRETAIVDPRH